jgi:Zn-dependent M28 family amino/carboxypeptidase
VTKNIISMTAVLAVLLVGSTHAARQTNGEKLRITALAVNMSNIGTGATATVDFDVDRWSTEADRTKLISVMTEKGPDALLETLRNMPSHGRMRFPAWQGPDPLNARLGWDIRYASQRSEPEGGRRIVLALDRYLSFWEIANRPRTVDYPFTFVEIKVDKNGEGEGKLSIATKVDFNKKTNTIQLETYASEPVRLQQVKVSPKT